MDFEGCGVFLSDFWIGVSMLAEDQEELNRKKQLYFVSSEAGNPA